MEAQQSKWETVKSLFEAAQGVSPEERSDFLAARCQDKEVCAEVTRLLGEYHEAESFLSTPAIGRISAPPLDETLRFSTGEILAGRFKVVEFIAAGGMGVVYKAEDLDLRRFVALKFVSVESADAGAQDRLRREAQAASALNHPNICTIYEVGNHAGRAFIAMEFLEGETLKQRIVEGPLGIETILNLSLEVSDALDAAHSAGVFHRDIKPANIFITTRGHAKILDFGIATANRLVTADDHSVTDAGDGSVTSLGVVAGTASYMSPEQIRGEQLDGRTDLFSFGVTLYEMAAAQLPFSGENIAAVCQAVLNTVPSPVTQLSTELPKELEAIIASCLEKDRDHRCQRAADLRAALDSLKRSRESGALIAGIRRRTLAAAAAAVIVVAVLGALFWYKARPVRLSEKDSVVLADFVNTTTDPVFSEALKAGLLADLGQSPFLNILSEDEIAKQLRFMGRPAGTALTVPVTREVCRRAGSKAMLGGSISSIGSHYAITLSASNCEDGSSLAVEQSEAKNREEVLSRLHEAARRLRGKLGESLASVEKHDIPLEQATTSSLEALQAFSQAQRAFRAQGETAAIPYFERALKLDPDFAVALSDLANMYKNLGDTDLCARYASKAYALRERVSERERVVIESSYFVDVTGELEKAARVFEQWKDLYPRSTYPHVMLGVVASSLGRVQAGLENDLVAYSIRKDIAVVYRNLSLDYLALNRLDEAKKILDEAHQKQLDASLLENYYQWAFLRGDQKEMDRCLSASVGRPDDEAAILASQADTEAYYGRLDKAREFSRRAIQSSIGGGSKDSAANWEATAAIREVEFGHREEASRHARASLALASSKVIQIAAALVFARSGDTLSAKRLIEKLRQQWPNDTLLTKYWTPTIQAAIALDRGDAKEALVQLDTAAPYELGGDRPPFSAGATLYPVYLRGLAYLREKDWTKARAEFQKMIANRGLVWNFPLAPLASLQLARASAGSDSADAKASYQQFLSLWAGADSEVPAYLQARRESVSLH